VDAFLAAVTSSLLTVLGTGLIQGRREARSQTKACDLKLRDALSEFGAALDALIVELQQLPAPQRRALALWGWVERRFPAFDFLVGRLARNLFGRQLYAALSRFQRATNELMLIAPPSVVEASIGIFDHLSSFADRSEDWFDRLHEERSSFAAVSRSLAFVEPPHDSAEAN
jgi:hypothetical protein